jgi:two-component sensor histidine kinase
LLRFVLRTRDSVLLHDALVANEFSSDAYLRDQRPRSVLCVPLVKQNVVTAVLYLENDLAPHVFTPARAGVLALVASQAAISLENAGLYSELQATLAEKNVLLKEVHHRVKNNLQLISSLLNLQAYRITDPATLELFADSRNRLRSMALVHENLYRAGNLARVPMQVHIQELCAHLFRAYAPRGDPVTFELRVAEQQFDLGSALTCGLIVNELVSNALKHAFPGRRPGRISVELERHEGTRHVLCVRDDGVGLPPALDFESADSLGFQLVRDFTEQLAGKVMVSREGGTTFTVTFDEAGRP